MLEEPLVVVKRKEWGAKKCVTGLLPVIPPLQYVVVHYYTGRKGCYSSTTCRDYVYKLQRRCIKERKLADIPFSFLIGPNEEIFEGRGWTITSDKSLPHKDKWGNKFDVAFIGNYLVKKPVPTVIKVLERVIQIGLNKRHLRKDYELLQVRDRPIKLEKYFIPPREKTQEKSSTKSDKMITATDMDPVVNVEP